MFCCFVTMLFCLENRLLNSIMYVLCNYDFNFTLRVYYADVTTALFLTMSDNIHTCRTNIILTKGTARAENEMDGN